MAGAAGARFATLRVLGALWLMGGAAAPLPAADAPFYPPWGLDLTAMDRSVRPGDDFNRYASGAWLDRTTLPADKPIVSLRTQQTDRIQQRLHELLESAAAQSDTTTLSGQVGAFYRSYMDTARIEALGQTPIAGELAAIRAAQSHAAIARLMGEAPAGFYASIYGLSIAADLKHVDAYAMYVGQAGLGLPDRDYYLQPGFAGERTAYRAYIAQLLSLLGWPEADARATAVLAFETQIARASWTRAQQRDLVATYNPRDRRPLGREIPGIAWDAFLQGAGLGKVRRVIVQEKSALPRIAAVYRATPLATLQAWQAFTVADNAAYLLAEPFATAHFEFHGHRLLGQATPAPRWQRAVVVVGGEDCDGERISCFGNMGPGVGALYAAQYFPPAARAAIEALVANVRAAMRARIEQLTWMGEATRREALAKLDTYQVKVGYPDHPRDYTGLQIRTDDVVGNVRRAAAWDWDFQVRRLDGPVDRSEWFMTAQTNDAYNGPYRDIVFPAGFLQPPVFDPAADPAVNYGAIGTVIGHELTHGFDDAGRTLDARGELRNWWTDADEREFRARTARLGAQYAAYEPVPGVHVNGDLTMGENIADLGGLNIALDAWHRSLGGRAAPVIDGFSGDQRFFLGQAQSWRGKPGEEFLRHQVVTDPHSPRMFRVIGPERNIDAWYEAFDIRPGDRYYLAPDERVRIW
jgi:putative endopeptidase